MLEQKPGSNMFNGELIMVQDGQIQQAHFIGEVDFFSQLTGAAIFEKEDEVWKVDLATLDEGPEGVLTRLNISICEAGTPDEYRRTDQLIVVFRK